MLLARREVKVRLLESAHLADTLILDRHVRFSAAYRSLNLPSGSAPARSLVLRQFLKSLQIQQGVRTILLLR